MADTGEVTGGASVRARLDPTQRAAVAAIVGASDPVLVTGGPGTGKTEVLMEAVAALVRAGVGLDRLVVVCHARSAAQRLRRQIMARLEGAYFGARITTVHGWCRQLLSAAAAPDEPPTRLLSAPEQEFRVRELLDEIGPQLWPEDLRVAARTQAFAGQVRDLLSRARQLGLDPEDVAAQGRRTGRPEWEAAGEFFEAYLDAIDAEHVIDYAELVHRTRILVSSPPGAASLRAGTRLVLVDELAEFDPAQWGLLRDAWAAGVPVAGFIDPSTSVFSFWGAQTRPVARFEQGFAGPDGSLTRFDLRRPWRGSPAVVAACARLASHLPVDDASAAVARADAATAVDGAADDGSVQVWLCGSARSRDTALARWLRAAHVDDGVPWNQMAVLGQTADAALGEVARGLAGAGVPVQVDGGGSGLAETPAVRQFLPVLALATDWAETGTPDPALARAALESRLAGIDPVELRRLAAQMRGPAEALGVRSDADVVARAFCAASSDGETDAQTPVDRLRTTWGEAVRQLGGGGDVAGLLWALWSTSPWPAQARSDALGGGLPAPQANADLDAVIALFDLAGQHPDWCGPAGLRRFLALVAQYQIESDTARESDSRGRGVHVLGVRHALGQGWPVVAVVGATEGRWPQSARAAGLLEPDALTGRLEGTDQAAGAGDAVRAQQRAFLLACSRAERRLLVVCDPGADDDAPRASRFAVQAGVACQTVAEIDAAPAGLPGLVARLRQASLDEQASPALRETAVRVLGDATTLRDDAGAPLAPGADPATWWGVPAVASGDVADAAEPDAARPVRLSGTDVAPLLACPRRWFLSRRAKGESRAGAKVRVGTLMHEVFREDADGGLGADGVAALLDERWGALPFEAPWQSRAERARAAQMYDRFVRWRDGRPDRELVAVEARFVWSCVCDGLPVQLRGTVDRLERDASGRLVVVDFKTGDDAKWKEHRDQMALYELAVVYGDFTGLPAGVLPPPGERVTAAPELVWPAERASRQTDPCPPKVQPLDSVAQCPHDKQMEFDSPDYPTWAQARLARAARIVRSGRFDARECDLCRSCQFRAGCPTRTTSEEE